MMNKKQEIRLWSEPNMVLELKEFLEKNQPILTSTDTVLGLLAPLTQQGYMKLDILKQRNNKPYLVLIDSASALSEFIDPITNFHIENLVNRCWPGPLTLIFKAKKTLPAFITGMEGTIALRVPDHTQLRQLAAHFHGLFSTSANIAHHSVPLLMADVDSTIMDGVAACVDDQVQEKKEVASTILDCSTGVIRVVRHGAYPIDELQKIAGVQFS